MRCTCLTLTLILAALAPSSADLSWEYVEKRNEKARQAARAKKRLEALAAQPSEEEKAAYASLAAALNSHPDMQAHNRAEASARARLQTAMAAGDAAKISAARTEVAHAATARYHKAASIPELARLITAWRTAAATPPAHPDEARQVQDNTRAIEIGLDDLFE